MTRTERDAMKVAIRASIQREMSEKKRGWAKRVDGLVWDLDHMSAADDINDRRVAVGLTAWPNALEG